MANRKTNLLITMIFNENQDMQKQINTELAFKEQVIKDLLHFMISREIKHFVIADDEVINRKLTEERKVGKWIPIWDEDHLVVLAYQCSECETMRNTKTNYCADCGAEMGGDEND